MGPNKLRVLQVFFDNCRDCPRRCATILRLTIFQIKDTNNNNNDNNNNNNNNNNYNKKTDLQEGINFNCISIAFAKLHLS